MPNAVVLVATEEQLRVWSPHLMHRGRVIGLPETDVPRIVETIRAERPTLLALEAGFAVTPRGRALRARLADDPKLAPCEICLITTQGRGISLSRLDDRVSKEHQPARDPHGTRLKPRYQFPTRPPVKLGDVRAGLIDLSTRGAQVTAHMPFWPGERRQLLLQDDELTLRLQAVVVWARPEQPTKSDSTYRMGLQFQETESDGAAIRGYSLRQINASSRK